MFGVCLCCGEKNPDKVLQRTYGCLRLTFSGYKFKLELCEFSAKIKQNAKKTKQFQWDVKNDGSLELKIKTKDDNAYEVQIEICRLFHCFIPRPNVGSAVIRLTRHKEMPVEVKDPALMFKIIRASFNQRRKTLQNGLGNAPELPYTKEQIAAAIAEMGLTPTIRGEALSLAQFAQLSDILGEMK